MVVFELVATVYDGVNAGTLVLFACVALVTWYYLKNRHGLPPGPWGVPLLGYLPFLAGAPTEEIFHRLSQKYGNVFSLKMGPLLFVVLGNYEAIKEAYVKQGDNFAGRPDGLLLKIYEDDTGLNVLEGEPWREHRRFALSTLRDFGMGKLSLEPRIVEEIHFFLAELAKEEGLPFDFHHLLGLSTVNIISSLEFGRRFDYNEERFRRLRKIQDDAVALFNTVPIRVFFPWVAKIKLLDRWTNESKLEKLHLETYKFFREMIEEHEKNHVDDSRTDYIDAYLTERKAIVEKTGNEGHFSHNILEGTLDILYLAGADSTKNTIRWAIMIMIYYPEMQARIRREIDDVIGLERAPTMSDMIRMKYTEAFLLEVHRYATVLPLNIVHANLEEAELFGHRIPKKTPIMANLWAVHFDPNLWDEPDKFNPERFIDEKGEVHKPEYLINFSLGKRVCIGESLARMELFLYLTSMLQRFTFLPPEGTEPTLDIESRFVRQPKPYSCCAVQRPEYQQHVN